MAKSKSNSSAKTQSASGTKRKASASTDGRSSSPAKKSPTSAPPSISNEQIGQAAGEIWGLLSRDGGQSLAAIKKSVDAPGDVVVAAIGWLAREDKLDFATSGRTVKISLR